MDELIKQARSGDPQAREQLLATMRPRLRQWAEHALNSRFKGRLDASDLTQITLLDLHRKLEQFVGSSEGELVDWLRRALDRNILDAVRQATAQKRNVGREQPLDLVLTDRSRPPQQLSAGNSTPSMKAMQNENAVRLQRAIDQLLPDQQAVVRLVHLQGHSLAQAAAQLDRSTAAAAKLLQRGMKNLRHALEESV